MKKYLAIIFISIALLISGCSGCSQSAQKKQMLQRVNNEQPNTNRRERSTPSESETTIKMEKVNGVYEIPTEIDGIPMHFIFDTGAGMISISETEAMFLYKQGKLLQEDIVGKANFTDANGDISEGTIIILRTVKLGNRVLKDVEASVVHNLGAPLLMGQSALEKFGKISIDYQRGEITFE